MQVEHRCSGAGKGMKPISRSELDTIIGYVIKRAEFVNLLTSYAGTCIDTDYDARLISRDEFCADLQELLEWQAVRLYGRDKK